MADLEFNKNANIFQRKQKNIFKCNQVWFLHSFKHFATALGHTDFQLLHKKIKLRFFFLEKKVAYVEDISLLCNFCDKGKDTGVFVIQSREL